MDPALRKRIAQMTVIALAWLAAGALAMQFFPARQGLAAIWPASGVALAGLLIAGIGAWPGIAVGSAVLGALSGLTPTENFALTAGNVLEAVAGAWLTIRAGGGPPRLATLKGVAALMCCGVLLGTGVGALACTLLMQAGGRETAAVLELQPWAAWLGNAMGALLVAPVALTWIRTRGRWTFRARPVEAALLALCAAAAGLFVFSRLAIAPAANPVPYLLFPLFFWAAIRFGMREVSGLLLATGLVAVFATCQGIGPFEGGDEAGNLVALYLFLAVAAAPTLVLAAVMAERAQAQEELAERERRYRLVVENQTELVVRLDRDSRVTFASPSLLAFLSLAARQVEGRLLELPIVEDDAPAFAGALDALLAEGGDFRSEVRLRGAGGVCWFAWTGRRDADGSGAVLVGRDVTSRRRAETQAKDHLEQLAHVTRVSSMGEMASAIAHEVNQPLTAIQTFADASRRLIDSGQAPPGAIGNALDRIAGEASRAGEIIRRTRRFVKNEPGRPGEVRVTDALREIVRLVGPDAQEAGVTILVDAGAEAGKILVDPIQLQQVLLNLVRNAIDAIVGRSEPGAPRRVSLSAARNGDEVRIVVADTGPGFGDSARVFEPFYTTKAQGLGIGLSISRSLVEANGGTLSGDSVPGEGATFLIRFPAYEGTSNP